MPTITLSDYETYVKDDGRTASRRVQVESQYPWEGYDLLQGGSGGIVFKREGGNYTTCFMEAFIDNTFIRGEGDTFAEAETHAWEQYKRRVACEPHEWEARGYHNGGAICAKCTSFGSEIFSGEQLRQFCKDCGVGTTYSWELIEGTNEFEYACEVHYVERRPFIQKLFKN